MEAKDKMIEDLIELDLGLTRKQAYTIANKYASLVNQRDAFGARLQEIIKGNPTKKRNPDTAYIEGKLTAEKNTYKAERDEAKQLLLDALGHTPVSLGARIEKFIESTKETPLTYKQLCERDERETANKAENEKPYFKVYINWRVWVLVAIVAVIVTPIAFVIYKLIA